MLAGRQIHLARGVAALNSGRGLVITGPAGVGKTHLARAITGGLDAGRTHVVWLAATRANQHVPFGAVAGLVPTSTSADATVVLPTIRDALAKEARGRRLVLVVDDAHLLDGPSAALVLGLATHTQILATVRSGTSRPDAVTALWKDGPIERLMLTSLDLADSTALAAGLVSGEVAGPTAEMLFQWTAGNALFLTELVRAGLRDGSLMREADLWWWRAPLRVPPVLADLLDRRLDDVGAAGRDALDAVALGEPLAVEVLECLVPSEVVVDLEDRELLRTHEGSEERTIVARFAHPLLGAAVRGQMSPARKRRSAGALLDAQTEVPRRPVEIVRNALWLVESGRPVDADLVLRAVALVLHADPDLAIRLATVLTQDRPSAPASVALADALVEAGRVEEARAVLERASPNTPGAQVVLGIALAGHRAWAERDPTGGHAELAALLAEVADPVALSEIRSVDALVLLFGGQALKALEAAETVLADPAAGRPAQLRAWLAQAAALTLVGQTSRSLRTGELAVAQTSEDPAGLPYAAGMALAVVALAQLWRSPVAEVPATHPAVGRWPVPPDQMLTGLTPTPWPLFDGYVRRVAGDLTGAAERLRVALVQQSGGEGLFRSEAAAWLSLCLAEAGDIHGAAEVLSTTPPDALALLPGLLPWARAGIAAARGDRDEALRQVGAAEAAARRAGCWLVELGYLLYEAEIRGPDGPSVVTERVRTALKHVDAPRLVVSARATLATVDARASAEELLEHVDALQRMGLLRSALDVAQVALSLEGCGRGHEVVEELRRRLGIVPAPADLTARETEIATLAAQGMTDREIAEHLVLSVRTVESHLCRVYRKLEVTSRRHLASVLKH